MQIKRGLGVQHFIFYYSVVSHNTKALYQIGCFILLVILLLFKKKKESINLNEALNLAIENIK